MKIRLKFQKQGHLKFIGHLDVMRTFQKLNRRADLDIAYSQGFSPHQEMSFATPLGLGLTSTSEYCDLILNSCPHRQELIDRMNAVNVEEMKILEACLLPDDAGNAMSILEAADYTLHFREGYEPADKEVWLDKFFAFLEKEEIPAIRESKTGQKEVDLKKLIRTAERRGEDIFLKVDAGSRSNLKPELVIKTFCESEGLDYIPMMFEINRDELYGEENGVLKGLMEYGTDF